MGDKEDRKMNILLTVVVSSIPLTISAGIICNSWKSTIYGIYAGMMIATLIYSVYRHKSNGAMRK